MSHLAATDHLYKSEDRQDRTSTERALCISSMPVDTERS